jgi:hypothetical protein
MLPEYRDSLTPNNPTGNKYSPSSQASQHVSITATLKTENTQKVGVFPPPLTHRMSIDLRSSAVNANHTPAPYGAEQPDRKWYSPSPQASQHFSITATLNTENTQKVGVFPPPLNHRMSHRLLVNDSRCISNAGTLWRRTTQPQSVFPVTASVTTLFHNRHAKYRKTQKVGVFPPPLTHRTTLDFRSTAVDDTGTSAPSGGKQFERNKYSSSPQASQHFSITATLNTGNTQKVGVFPPPLTHRMSHRLPVNGI